MNTDNYDMNLTARENLVKRNQIHMVEVAKLERLVDEAYFNLGKYKAFLDIAERRYPLEFHDVLLEFNL